MCPCQPGGGPLVDDPFELLFPLPDLEDPLPDLPLLLLELDDDGPHQPCLPQPPCQLVTASSEEELLFELEPLPDLVDPLPLPPPDLPDLPLLELEESPPAQAQCPW